MSLMGFQKKLDGGSLRSIQFLLDFWIFFNFEKRRSTQLVDEQTGRRWFIVDNCSNIKHSEHIVSPSATYHTNCEVAVTSVTSTQHLVLYGTWCINIMIISVFRT